MSKRLIAVVSLCVGLVLGAFVGPALTQRAFAKNSYVYRCVGDSSSSSHSISVRDVSSSIAKIHVEAFNNNGTIANSVVFQLNPQATYTFDLGSATSANLSSNKKLLVDGRTFYENGVGTDNDMVREIRCT